MIKPFQSKVMRGIKSRLATLFTAAVVLSSTTVSWAQEHIEFSPFEAKYTAYRWNDDVGYALLKLEKLDAGHYSLHYHSKVSKFFLSDKRAETSHFVVEGEQITPIDYQYTRTGTGKDKSLNLQFVTDEPKHIVVNEETQLDWAGEWDNQLYRIDLPRQLAAGKEEIPYDFINTRGEKRRYVMKVVDREALSLPYGELDTIKVKIMRESNKRVTFAWFAPALDFNLVRLQQFKEGKEQGDIQLASYTPL